MTEEKKPTGRERQLAALEAHRTATQFGSEKGNAPNNTPEGANTKSWSIRHALRYLARQQVDPTNPRAFSNILPAKPTIAQVIAANTLAKASKADMRAVECVIDQIDGKVPQVNVNTDLKHFEDMTEEELLEYNRKLDERIAAASARHDAGGDAAPQGDGSAAAGEGQGADEGAATAGSDQPIG